METEIEAAVAPDDTLADGLVAVESSLPGNVWKVLVEPGDIVAAGDAVVIIESMKMEMRIVSPRWGGGDGGIMRAGDERFEPVSASWSSPTDLSA